MLENISNIYLIGPNQPDVLNPSLSCISEAWELIWICIQSHPTSPPHGAFSLVVENAHSAEASETWLNKNPDQAPPHWSNPNQLNPKPSAMATMEPWQPRHTNWCSNQIKTNARWMWNYMVIIYKHEMDVKQNGSQSNINKPTQTNWTKHKQCKPTHTN